VKDARDEKMLAASVAVSEGKSAFPKVTKTSSVNLILDLILGHEYSFFFFKFKVLHEI
jgi:hypothetical protein